MTPPLFIFFLIQYRKDINKSTENILASYILLGQLSWFLTLQKISEY